jgi:hypothetical protein
LQRQRWLSTFAQGWDALLKQHVILISSGNASQLRYAEMAKPRSAQLQLVAQRLSSVVRELREATYGDPPQRRCRSRAG